MSHKPKKYTLNFYQLSMPESVNLSQAKAALCDFFTSKQNPTPNAPIADYEIQLQDIAEFESMKCSLVSGVVKKFHTNLPMTGVVGQTSEKKMELKKNEFPVERTYFIYNLSNNVLLYQDNPQGTSCSYFRKYLIEQNTFADIKHVLFSFIPTYEAYEMLKRGDIQVKKLKIHIPRPITMDLFNIENNPSLVKVLDLMDNLGGDLDLTVNESSNRSLINPEVSKFLRSIREMFKNGPKSAGARGKIEAINEDGSIYPIDLLMDRLFDTVTVSISDKYPKAEEIIQKMKTVFIEKQDILNKL